jgi:hypothetical protein
VRHDWRCRRSKVSAVSEYQRRGLVHLHPVIRLDRRMPAYRADELRPPDRRFTIDLLEQALRAAVEDVFVRVPEELGAGVVRWGTTARRPTTRRR